MHALQYWRGLPGPDTPEPSEAGSSIKGLVADACYSNVSKSSVHISFILCLMLILVFMVNTLFLLLSIMHHPNSFLLLLNVC